MSSSWVWFVLLLTPVLSAPQSGVINKVKSAITGDTEEEENSVCFNRLGCFEMKSPWKSLLRPIPAPFAPENISTALYFYSRPNVEERQTVQLHPDIVVPRGYDPRKPTVTICHGFSSNGNSSWLAEMKDAYLKQRDVNVFLVDWGLGASLFNYLQVAGNTRVVARELTRFLNHLIEQKGAKPQDFHLIGHSLGAQISSYVCKDTPGVARLTALDPAQPGFEGFSKEVRLDESDAEFVEVYHTDAKPTIPTLGFGMITPHGHVDFYMNGGFEQPGCIIPPKDDLPEINNILDLAKYPVEIIANAISCPHGRSYKYFTEAIKETSCIMWGHKASVGTVAKGVTNTVTQGFINKYVALSTNCTKEDCIPVGLGSIKSDVRGTVVTTTDRDVPYCISEPGIPPENEGSGLTSSKDKHKLPSPTGAVDTAGSFINKAKSFG